MTAQTDRQYSTVGCCGPEGHAGESQKVSTENTSLVDRKVTMLIAAGAAMAANCESCLNQVVPDLIEAGVAAADIRATVEIGQFVKDRPAAVMKTAADVLTGSQLSSGPTSEECPAKAMNHENG